MSNKSAHSLKNLVIPIRFGRRHFRLAKGLLDPAAGCSTEAHALLNSKGREKVRGCTLMLGLLYQLLTCYARVLMWSVAFFFFFGSMALRS